MWLFWLCTRGDGTSYDGGDSSCCDATSGDCTCGDSSVDFGDSSVDFGDSSDGNGSLARVAFCCLA